jgi:hypothetical protein
MSKLRNLRDIGLVLAGVLAGACLFSLPKQASSAFREGEAVVGAIIIEKDKKIECSVGRITLKGGEESHDVPVTTNPPAFHRDCFQITKTVAR